MNDVLQVQKSTKGFDNDACGLQGALSFPATIAQALAVAAAGAVNLASGNVDLPPGKYRAFIGGSEDPAVPTMRMGNLSVGGVAVTSSMSGLNSPGTIMESARGAMGIQFQVKGGSTSFTWAGTNASAATTHDYYLVIMPLEMAVERGN
ncbi:MAG TPA: hypothetical protein PK625_00150 [Spirochaetales bacterium]|nr:hypothetical protein [Spirochaetales bacterium]